MPEAKRQMDELFVGKDRTRLASLRKKDPQKNLAQRWERVLEGRPDVAERRLGYVPQIVSQGWAVIAIPDEGFAYTIGLKYRFDQPELLVAAPDLGPEELGRLLNVIGAYVALGNRIGPDEPVDLTDFDLTLVFRPYSHKMFSRYATGYLSTFERYFEDRYHETGDTLPVLWTELVSKKKAAKRAKKAVAEKPTAKKAKAAAKKPTAKKAKAASKKPAAKKAKPAPKQPAAKKAKAASKKPARTSR